VWPNQNRHPCPPVLPQGNSDQLRKKLLLSPGSVKAILPLLRVGPGLGSRASGASNRGPRGKRDYIGPMQP
jgi:hypothetical protein